MTAKGLDALTAGNHHTDSLVFHLLMNGLRDLRHILGQRNNHAQMLLGNTESAADILYLTRTGRVLTTRHTGRKVVADHHHHVGVGIHGIQQIGHAGMGERRVADDGH